jgi:hypothetical protein
LRKQVAWVEKRPLKLMAQSSIVRSAVKADHSALSSTRVQLKRKVKLALKKLDTEADNASDA